MTKFNWARNSIDAIVSLAKSGTAPAQATVCRLLFFFVGELRYDSAR
jgi:hypothetical protein